MPARHAASLPRSSSSATVSHDGPKDRISESQSSGRAPRVRPRLYAAFDSAAATVFGSRTTSGASAGNTVSGSDGNRFEIQGKTTYGSDGSVCRTRGRLVECGAQVAPPSRDR